MNAQRQQLLSRLNMYGYELVEPDMLPDPDQLVAELVESRDARLLEGFPVVLANVLDHNSDKFHVGRVEKLLRTAVERKRFREMLTMSATLLKFYNVRMPESFHKFTSLMRGGRALLSKMALLR